MHNDFSERQRYINSQSDNFSHQINVVEEQMLKESNDSRSKIVDLEQT